MSDNYTPLREALAAGPTPGPWRWEISVSGKSVHLVGGRPRFDLTLMDFVRWGMGGAVPRFREPTEAGLQIMHRLCDRYDWIAPFAGREHHSSWCANVTHPDAAYIAAANPATVAALLAERDALAAEVERLRADAERYRWLCANYAIGDGFDRIDRALNDGEADTQLNAAIDAARKEAAHG